MFDRNLDAPLGRLFIWTTKAAMKLRKEVHVDYSTVNYIITIMIG